MPNKELKELSDFLGVNIPDLVGEKGDQGEKGDTGEKGDKGDKGDKGESGDDGKNGKDGKDGKNGKDGKDGKEGKKGDKGDRGEKGESGKDGKDGKSGKDGRSAPSGYSYLQRKFDYKVHTQTGATRNHAAKSGWEVILCDCTSNAITVNLPSAIGNQARLTIKKIDSGGNAVTVDGQGSQTIDGSETATLSAQYASVTIISDNNNWFIV